MSGTQKKKKNKLYLLLANAEFDHKWRLLPEVREPHKPEQNSSFSQYDTSQVLCHTYLGSLAFA